MPFAGGIIQHGYQCGMIWGAVFAAGAQAYRLFGPGPKAETMAIMASQRIVESFRDQNSHINCLEITELDKSSSAWDQIFYFLVKGGSIGCFRMSARYAPVAYDVINKTFSEKQIEKSSTPVSCASLLAQEMGASDLHTVMSAGLAGGIGLCGGACGALGAAIWLNSLQCIRKGEKLDFKNPKALSIIENFIKSTHYEFECSKIVGRRFNNIKDHSDYLIKGGCSNIIDILSRCRTDCSK